MVNVYYGGRPVFNNLGRICGPLHILCPHYRVRLRASNNIGGAAAFGEYLYLLFKYVV